MSDDKNLLAEFEVISLEEVVIIGDVEQKIEDRPTNEVDRARVKLAEKLKILKEDQVIQKLEREQIKKELDELKRSNDEKRSEEKKKIQKAIDAKLAKLEDHEKARKLEFEKYLKRYQENHKDTSQFRQQSVDGTFEAEKIKTKVKRAKSERFSDGSKSRNTARASREPDGS